MLGNRRSLSTRQSNGKKRVDIVYRSKWITNNFVVGDPLGAGSFGKVWTVECRKKPAQLYALKVPAPGFNPKHIAMELKVMRAISGGPNVVEFIAAYRELDRVFVVMNLFPHDDIFVMRAISGGPNVVEFIAAYRELDRVFVVMNLFPHDDIFVQSHP
ncbi:unnamed protein product [Strongylus vulgaris]|uniref:Protein kinase domain-containing protein n=1 Tax=Strongylus vulgaris TaxID=40348 RepID=A0A3P7JT31_STRVU|nr:unnamed protein product [Strongylus vulgaris]